MTSGSCSLKLKSYDRTPGKSCHQQRSMTKLRIVGNNDHYHTTTTTVLRPFYRDQSSEPVPEENFWTLWCKRRLTEADTLTIRLGATPPGLTSAYLHHPPIFFTGRMPFLLPNQQRQSTGGKIMTTTAGEIPKNCEAFCFSFLTLEKLTSQMQSKPGIGRVQALTDISHLALCCHSNETCSPVANLPNSAQLQGTPTVPRVTSGSMQ